MPYKIDVYPDAQEQILHLPAGVPAALAEAMAVLELVPWNGKPYADDKPDGNMRQLVFAGSGLVIYLILEDQQRVDVLK